VPGNFRKLPEYLIPRAVVVDHCGEAVGAACAAVLDAAHEHVSSGRSSNAGKAIREIFNFTLAVRRPGMRVVEDIDRTDAFSPALSAARFLYMLSGSDRMAPIRFSFPPSSISVSKHGRCTARRPAVNSRACCWP